MMRARFWGFSGLVLAGAAMACGGEVGGQGLSDGVANTTDCVHSGVDGVTCYPTGDLGIAARTTKDGEVVFGNRIANLQFVGFRATTTAAPLDVSKGTTIVQMADYYDPRAEKYSLIVAFACQRWCGPCNQTADQLAAGVAATYENKGVVFMQALTQGLDFKPTTLSDLTGWAGDHKVNFTLLSDPAEHIFGNYDVKAATPFIMMIDPRTMEILTFATGAPSYWPTFLDPWLKKMAEGPRKPEPGRH